MRKKNLSIFLSFIILLMSCHKQETEILAKDYKKITVVRTKSGYSGSVDSLIIELNNNSTIKAIKAFAFLTDKTISDQKIKNFIYQPNSTIPDSSLIETRDWRGVTANYTEKYLYDNGKIVNVYSAVIEDGGSNSLIIYTYNLEGKIVNKYNSYIYHQDTINSNLKYEYNGKNISYSAYQAGSPFPESYNNIYITFDDKINPLNNLFRKCNFPFEDEIISLFPREFLFSENNPTKMKLNSPGIIVNQSYKYNQFNYPTEVISNFVYYNVRFYYE